MALTAVGSDFLEPPETSGCWCCGDRTVQASFVRLGGASRVRTGDRPCRHPGNERGVCGTAAAAPRLGRRLHRAPVLIALLVPIEWVARLVPASDQPAAVARLRDAYLEPWANRADGRTAALATWVGYVARAALNADQAVGSSGALVSDHQREIIALLRTCHTKRSMLHRLSDLLTPLMVW